MLSYLRHGSHAVWVVYPEQRAVRTFDRNGHSRLLKETDVLDCPELLPGFQLPVARIFEET
ncbi:MAG: Uma2 family endonuclease [Acidobacteria bacterium]|nr:Uma2 family endonuclease [Acidobacteriota bacterium]